MAYVGIGLQTRKDVSYECLSNGRCKAKFTILNLTQADIQAAGGFSLAEGLSNNHKPWEAPRGAGPQQSEMGTKHDGRRRLKPVSSAVNSGKSHCSLMLFWCTQGSA